jgi:hypothetical protein
LNRHVFFCLFQFFLIRDDAQGRLGGQTQETARIKSSDNEKAIVIVFNGRRIQ